MEKACKEFTARASPLGFQRTKKTIWTRRNPHTVDFISFFRKGSSYGAPRTASVQIRLHLGIRVLNDGFTALATNGPTSDADILNKGRYHLRFNGISGDTFDRCSDDLVRFVREQGEPWFRKFALTDNLISRADSPLKANVKTLLKQALDGSPNLENVAKSLQLLGIK